MAVTSAEQAATLVKTALNGAGLGATFTVVRWPNYAPDDLDCPKWHVVSQWPVTHEAIDDNGSALRQPIAVTVDARVEKDDDAAIEALTARMEAVAEWLARHEIGGLGYPIEPLEIDRNDQTLDASGHFVGQVNVAYRRYRSDDEGDE